MDAKKTKEGEKTMYKNTQSPGSTPSPSAQSEWYFGKWGVLECYDVIILFKDSEVAQPNGVKPRRAVCTVPGHFRERYMRFSCSSSSTNPPATPPVNLHLRLGAAAAAALGRGSPAFSRPYLSKQSSDSAVLFPYPPVPRVNLANFTGRATFTPLATCLPVLHSG